MDKDVEFLKTVGDFHVKSISRRFMISRDEIFCEILMHYVVPLLAF